MPTSAGGRPRRFCSSACRQRAYRVRTGAPAAAAPDPYWSDDRTALYVGQATSVLRRLPTNLVHCVVTSPPYYTLRDYDGLEGQIGNEATPGEYVEALRAVFGELARVVRDDGTVWLNLGDCYSARANGGPSASSRAAGRGHRPGINAKRRVNTIAYAPYKSLLGMPWRVAFALRDDGWIIRNAIVWHKTNARPDSAGDRLATRYEHLFLLTRRARYYFDLDAIRVPQKTAGERHEGRSCGSRDGWPTAWSTQRRSLHPQGANPGDVWPIPTRRSQDAHFAMFPIDVPLRCIAAGCPAGGLVLDPFSGAGTAGRAARSLGRRYVGIDLNPAYHDMAIKNLAQVLPV